MAFSVQGRPGDALPFRLLVPLKLAMPTPSCLLARALAWANQAFNNTCRMNSVPMPCGPTGPICAAPMDSVAMATDQCLRTAGSHN